MPTLHLVTGAPGSGKSTVLPHLAHYPFGAVDFDELLEPGGSLLGLKVASPDAEAVWPLYNGLWARIVAMLLRAGGPVLVMCPLTPDEWERATAGVAGLPRAAWARLDCDDEERRTRLAARGWGDAPVEEALRDADDLRRVVDREFTTSGRSAADVAAALAAWVGGAT
ncbi:AAA family ATPase [Streptomyces johnsoniae]|uniref:AAA family ATPase n=1 Tax=Streptomyces johnsoniae TaxID=3075532 RepID=A0ABU2S1R0_9ACTN|nr:AAA family ATPase [Streptomyces sp. DSM 41886]MDT0442870.1 AAA family ATPase [Streptomyces sp. DSM 41886]